MSHTANDIPPGAWIKDPQLGADFAPRGSSPALDHCDSLTYSPVSDAYRQNVYDVPGISNRWSSTLPDARDLGAIEQTDIIYANNFGYRPDN